MLFVIVFETKSFSADLAVEFELSSMNFYMLIQVTSLGISFATLTACVFVTVILGFQYRRHHLLNFVTFTLYMSNK